jgi:dihydropteroate synthase
MLNAARAFDPSAVIASGRPAVMGILNVTPDSFSDGGEFLSPTRAIVRAKEMIGQGADIVDVGAESTRPYGGAEPVDEEEEMARLARVFPEITTFGRPVSIDTTKASVARWALDQGAAIVNDVWGLQRDAEMARVVADYGATVVVMHNRDAVDPSIDIMKDIAAFFHRSLEIAARGGIPDDRIVLDPGIGFGKTPEQSLHTLARLDDLRDFGRPLLVGASRKRFIDAVSPSSPQRRLGGSLAALLAVAAAGAAFVRVHDVAETVQALEVSKAIRDLRCQI